MAMCIDIQHTTKLLTTKRRGDHLFIMTITDILLIILDRMTLSPNFLQWCCEARSEVIQVVLFDVVLTCERHHWRPLKKKSLSNKQSFPKTVITINIISRLPSF